MGRSSGGRSGRSSANRPSLRSLVHEGTILSPRVEIRVGLGYDRHRLEPGEGPLLLGGVEIPFDRVLIGHSDADAVLHAVTDALLGAAGLGDIGELFPNDDARNFRRDSSEMLSLAWQSARSGGWNLVNVDIVVLAQAPKIAPHKDAIRRRLAEILGVEPDQVNVKGKTGEGVGPIGQSEAIDVHCVALLERGDRDEEE